MTDLWTCPDCGRRFSNLNQAHSCLDMTVDEHLADASPLAVELYRAVKGALAECGEFRIHPQKTRIAFVARMSFAGMRFARRWVDLGFITPTPVGSERIRSVELYGPTSFGNEVRLASVDDVDNEVRRWLCIAYERGTQETLDPKAPVSPVTGVTLERLSVPLAAKVVAIEDDLGVSIPAWAAAAFGAHPAVTARIGGDTIHGAIIDGVLCVDPGGTGLGEGDPLDVFLKADL